jgi:transposase
VLGALNFVSKKLETITNDTYITSTQVIALIDNIVKSYIGIPIKLVLDNASYQKCKLVMNYAKQKGVELVFLPPYSPNINLIERLWKFVKSEVLNAAYYGTFDDFKKAINDCIENLNGKYKVRIDTLITENVQLFDNLKAFRLVA